MAGNRRRADRGRRALGAVAGLFGGGGGWLRRVRSLALLGAAGAGAWFGGHAGWDAARRSPYFLVRHVEVGELARVERDEVLRLAGLAHPVGIFDFDPATAEQALRTHPWIRAAEVERKLPDGVRIRLTQREPAAVVALSGLYLVDAAGHPFVKPAADQLGGLPLITGLTRAEYEADPDEARARLVTAMSLARMYQMSSAAATRPLGSVHLSAGGRYELMLGKTRVALGRDDHRRKLADLVRVLEKLKSRNVDASYILMDEAGQRAIVKETPLQEIITGSLTMRAGGEKN
jgi:cell division protein FtsQ